MKRKTEIWKDIVGYEGLYFVSNLGNVANIDGKILSLETSQRGYLRVSLSKDGVKKNMKVHRLVATAFIPNPHSLPQVNHINECKTDNRVSNLCWVDNRCNALMNSNKGKAKKKVAIVGENGELVAVFNSISLAERITGVSRYGIMSACSGIQVRAGGYEWKFVDKDGYESRNKG